MYIARFKSKNNETSKEVNNFHEAIDFLNDKMDNCHESNQEALILKEDNLNPIRFHNTYKIIASLRTIK